MVEAWICQGKDCRKSKGFEKLLASLPGARSVRCQKICKGPVVGMRVDGKLQWFAKVRGSALRKAVRAAMEGTMTDALWKLRSKERKGKVRK